MGIHEMVKRLLLLSKLESGRIPSKQTAVYIQEAVRTYLHGLFQASAAMSRAALEQGLKENLGRQGGDNDFIKFKDLVKEATRCNLLDKGLSDMMVETAKQANRVLHEGPTDHDGALQVLTEVRGYLKQLYSAKGGY